MRAIKLPCLTFAGEVIKVEILCGGRPRRYQKLVICI